MSTKGWLKYTTQDMNDLALSRGFSFLSDHYKGISIKHKWECKQGHIWEAKPCAIKTGSGCKRCSAAQLRTSIEDAHKIAENRGFEFLSKKFRGMKHKHVWGCQDGHTWEAAPHSIKSGTGCPKCRKLNEEKVRFIFESLTQEQFPTNRTVLSGLELDGYCKKLDIAFEYQGKQHYDPHSYYHRTSNSFEDLKKRDQRKIDKCSKLNIALLVVPYTKSKDCKNLEQFIRDFLIYFGFPTTLVDWSQFESSKSKLAKLTNAATRQCVALLDKVYLGAHYKHAFKCIKCDHVWKTEARYIVRGVGCPACAGNQKYTKLEVQDIARQKQILMLSKSYKNAHTKYRWECAKCNHVWQAKFNNIQQFKGCPKCAGNLPLSLEDMHDLAKKKNLMFLSKKYTRSSDKHEWQCQICGTIWNACPRDVKSGTGCPGYSCVQQKKLETRQRNRKEVC